MRRPLAGLMGPRATRNGRFGARGGAGRPGSKAEADATKQHAVQSWHLTCGGEISIADRCSCSKVNGCPRARGGVSDPMYT